MKTVREFFARLVKSGKTHHAYLFAGPRGTGKTSAARILAKIVNCESKKIPCDKCENCVAITRGNFPDLIEIDAASNRGIDDVRALRETVGLAPMRGKKKVYLIDEVHMLTPEAFNALLKTLEEPPAQVMFILATTEPDKLPETVVSRCIRVDFGRAGEAEIIASLKKIVKTEELEVEEEALAELARLAQGSFRDAQKTLEQVVTGREKEKITIDLVSQFGSDKLLEYLLTKERVRALDEIGKLEKSGANWKNVVLDLVEKLRPDVLARSTALGVNWQEKKELLEKLVQAGGELKEAVIPQLPLELLVVEWCGGSNDSGVTVVGAQIPSPRNTRGGVRLRSQPATPPSSVGGKVSFDEVQGKWQEVLQQLKPKNHSLAGLLRSSRPSTVDGDELTIEVFYQFHLDQLKQEKYRLMVEEALEDVFAFPLKLQYILREKQKMDHDVAQAAEEVFGDVR
jgi:DNA polymerase III subunit gamma/tau